MPAATGPQYAGARLAIFWKDLNMLRNVGINPIAGLHVQTDASGGAGNNVCYVTWWDVGEFNTVSGTGVQGHTQWTFQMVLFEATGVVQFRYGNVPVYATASTTTVGCHATIAGFSPGRIGGVLGNNSVNPQNRDLSLEVPFATMPEGAFGNMGQVAVAAPVVGGLQYGGRMFGGQTVSWNAVNVPPGTVLGAQLVDVGATRPGLQFPGITAPGCMLSTTTGGVVVGAVRAAGLDRDRHGPVGGAARLRGHRDLRPVRRAGRAARRPQPGHGVEQRDQTPHRTELTGGLTPAPAAHLERIGDPLGGAHGCGSPKGHLAQRASIIRRRRNRVQCARASSHRLNGP
ncbi:MAG TPA: hypothetical protein VFD82_01080 [Planctomycetota bacterium]|nr:hypothetical protein [Planctomycetota bacterium]